jgi:hypothetical protein
LTEILCKREQRYVGAQLAFSFERKRIMLEETEVTRGLVGRYVETYAYADGRNTVVGNKDFLDLNPRAFSTLSLVATLGRVLSTGG